MPEVAPGEAPEEGEVLLVRRPVEPVARDRGRPDLLVRVGRDQEVHGVADHEHRDEDE